MSTVAMPVEQPVRRTDAEIVNWCRTYISRILDIPESKIDPAAEFESFGLDSAVAVALVAEISVWLGTEVEPSELFEYPTIASFAAHLSDGK